MERPQSIFGLTKHIVVTRWNALSSRGRMLTIGALALGSITTAAAAHSVMGGCCASSCASRRAHFESADIVNADLGGEAVDVAAAAPATTGCPHAR